MNFRNASIPLEHFFKFSQDTFISNLSSLLFDVEHLGGLGLNTLDFALAQIANVLPAALKV